MRVRLYLDGEKQSASGVLRAWENAEGHRQYNLKCATNAHLPVLSAFAGIGLAGWPNHCVIWGFNHTTRSEPASLVWRVLTCPTFMVNNLYQIEADAQKHNDHPMCDQERAKR
jgi:hypothetical protein